MESRVGCGFIMLSYYVLCMGDTEKASYYAQISKRITENLSLYNTDLHMNTIIGSAYPSRNYEERMKLFQTLGNGKTLGDIMFCLVGQVETELVFRENPNWPQLIDMLMRAMRLQNEAGSQFYAREQEKFLHDILLNGGLTKTLYCANFTDLALEYARKTLLFTNSSQFGYACVGVVCNALDAIADVFIDQQCDIELARVKR